MIPVERQRQILQLLEQQGTVSIAQLCDVLDVSHMTVRRDISALEDLGRVVSVSGGATLPARLGQDQSHAIKESIHQEGKAAIARHAAGMVAPGDLVLLDAGTTTLALARQLASRSDLSFVTSDLTIATSLSEYAHGAGLYLAGGTVDRSNLSTEGAQVAAAIAEYNVDIAFLSTSSFDLRGISVPTEAKKVVKRAIVENARQTVLITDSTKYGKVAALRAARLPELGTIITDSGLPEPARDGIRRHDVQLVIVDGSPSSPTAHSSSTARKVHS